MADPPQVYPFGISEYVDQEEPPRRSRRGSRRTRSPGCSPVGWPVRWWVGTRRPRSGPRPGGDPAEHVTGPAGSRRSVVVWVGHRSPRPGMATLVVRGGPGSTMNDGLLPEELVVRIRAARRRWARDDDGEAPWMVVIVEACGAGMFVRNSPPPWMRSVRPGLRRGAAGQDRKLLGAQRVGHGVRAVGLGPVSWVMGASSG